MKITGDQHLMKKINKSIVLDTIIHRAPLSRADISSLVGLNKGTVSALVNELIEEHFVAETGPGESSGGRKPVMLLFNPHAGYAIGVDLGVNYILAVATDISGNIVKEKRIELTELDLDFVYKQLLKGIRALIKQIPPSPYGIVGIGVGIPGTVDERGVILSAPNLGWDNVPLQEMLLRDLALPVKIDNEANAGAVAEKEYGTAKNATNLIYVSVGIGIGTGIILHNELYRGFGGFSGELGHMSIQADGPRCTCGNFGCWELYASENALLRSAKKADVARQLGIAPEKCSLKALVHAAKAQNPLVLQLFEQIGVHLGIGITNIIHTFNPETIIIGNRMSLASAWILKPIMETIEKRCIPLHRSQLKIGFSALGIKSTALGAASFAITRFFSSFKTRIDS